MCAPDVRCPAAVALSRDSTAQLWVCTVDRWKGTAMTTDAKSQTKDLTAYLHGVVDEIIKRASLDPEDVLREFDARGIRRPDGTPFLTIDEVREYITPEKARQLSQRYVNTYARMAVGQGFVTGLGGIITLPATVPADAAAYVAWLARGASAVQLAHGHETRTPVGDAQLKLAMLAGAGVSQVTINGTKVLVTQMAKKVATTPYAKAPIQAALKALAAKLGVQLTHKSFAKAVPILGGAINGSVQGGMVKVAGNRIVAHYQDLAVSQAW